jgi:Ring finger domain
MLTLANILGPVRPPVATNQDVERAGGLFTLLPTVPSPPSTATSLPTADFSLAAVPTDPTQGTAPVFTVSPTDTCLVCLSTYAAKEQVRELAKCHHRFHRACIDEWLTTGRNSCPLCRGAGVAAEEAAAAA